MATNPMQKQARASFLLGVVVTIIIAGAIVAFLFMQMNKMKEKIDEEEAATVSVYVLNQDVKSGQVITTDMFKMEKVKNSGVPQDATNDIATLLNTYSLCDKAGNNIYTNSEGKLYMKKDGTDVTVEKEVATDSYYTVENGTKKYIETTQKPIIAKVNMKAKTIIAGSYIARADQIDTDDVRQQEYNVIVLSTDLMTGDYIDVRLMLPNGQDFIVVSKKSVTIPQTSGEYSPNAIWLKLSEDEILTMSSAIVEAFQIPGSKLYATKYTDAGSQEAATPTYIASQAVVELMDKNPNITEEAMNGLRTRYTEGLKNIRQTIEGIKQQNEEETDSIQDKMEESITSTLESRQTYLQSLTQTAPVE